MQKLRKASIPIIAVSFFLFFIVLLVTRSDPAYFPLALIPILLTATLLGIKGGIASSLIAATLVSLMITKEQGLPWPSRYIPNLTLGFLIYMLSGLFAGLWTTAERRRLKMEGEVLRRAERLAAVSHISATISSSLELKAVLSTAAQKMVELFGVEHSGVLIFDEEKEWGHVLAEYPDWGAIGERFQVKGYLGAESLITDQKPLMIEDTLKDPLMVKVRDTVHKLGIRSMLILPLVVKGETIGSIGLDAKERRVFSQEEIELAQTIANQVSVAIENARLYEETKRRAEEMSALRETMLDITGRLDMPQLLTSIIERASRLVGATGGLIHLYDAKRGELRCCVSHNLEKDYTGLTLTVGEGVAGKVVQQGKPLIIADHRTWEGKSPQVADSIARAIVAVPLKWQDRIIGVLDIMDLTGEKVFDQRDAHLLTLFADQAAMAIQNAQLYQQIQDQLNELRTLQGITSTLQSSLSLQEVLDRIVQAVTELGYTAAMLAQYEKETNRLVVQAYSVDPALLEEGQDLAGVEMKGAYVTLDQTESLCVRMALAGEIGITHCLHDLFRPVVNAEICQIIQEMTGLKTMATIPLLAKGKLVGNMFVGTDREEITEGELDSLRAFANQAALAIHNARLFEEQKRHVARLAVITEVSQRISSILSLDELLPKVATAIHQGFGYYDVSIFLVDETAQEVELKAMAGGYQGVIPMGYRQAIGLGIVGWAAKTGRSLLANDVRQEPRYIQAFEEEALTQAELAVPIKLGDTVFGVLDVQDTRRNAFAQADVWALETLADQIAVAIGKARLFTSLTQEKERLGLLYRLRQHLSESLDIHDVAQRALDDMCTVVGALRGIIMLREPDSDRLRLVAVSGYDAESVEALDQRIRLRLGEGLAGWVAAQRQPALVDDVTRDERWKQVSGLDDWVRSALSVPLLSGDELVGVFSIYSDQEAFFHDDHRRLAEAAAATVAVAIENARLFETERRRRQEAETLQEVAQALNQALDLQEMLDIVLREAMALVGRNEGSIILLDRETNTMRIVASCGLPLEVVEGFNRRPVYAHEGTFGIVLQTGELLEIPDARSDPRVLHGVGHVSKQLTNVPLRTEEGVIGVIALDGLPHDEQARRLLLALADLAAVAIQRARLFEAERRQRREAETLRRAALALSTTLDLPQVFETILSELQRVVPYDSASVQLLRGDHLEIIGGRGFPKLDRLLGISFPVDGDNPNREVMRRRAPFIVEDAPAIYPDFRKEPHAAANIRSWLGVPLLVGDRLIGMIALDKRQPGFYTQEHAQSALAFAAQAAIAIENARLFGEARQRLAGLEALQRTSLQLISSLDLSAVLDSIAESALALVGATDCHIYLYDEASETFSFGTALWQDGRREPAVKVPRRNGLTATVAREGRPIIINDASHHPLFSTPEARKWGLQAIASFPLKRAGRVLGVLNIAFLEPHSFSGEELRVLGLLADQAAIAIENARLYREAQGYTDKLTTLYETGKDLTSTLELDALLQLIVERAARLTGADKSLILLVDVGTEKLTKAVGFGFAPGQVDGITYQEVQDGISGWVLKERKPTISEDILTDPRNTGLALEMVKKERERGKSVAVAPLSIKGEVIGTLTVVNNVGKPVFGQEDLDMIVMLASQAAITIENARLYEETQRRLQEMSLLNEINGILTSTLDLEEMLTSLMQRVYQAMEVEAASLFLLDEERQELTFQVALGEKGARIKHSRLPLGAGIAGWVVQKGEPLLVPDVKRDSRHYPEIDRRAGFVSRSILCVPLKIKDKTLGCIEVINKVEGEFGQDDLRLLNAVAASTAAAIENAQLYEETRRRLRELTALTRVSDALNQALDLQQILDIVLREAFSLVGRREAFIALARPDGKTVEIVVSRGLPDEVVRAMNERPIYRHEGTFAYVFGEGQMVEVADTASDPRVAYFDRPAPPQLTDVPLIVGDQVIGLISLDALPPDDATRRLLRALADMAAVAIERARLYEEVREYAASLEQKVIARTAEIRLEKERTEAILRSVADAVIVTDLKGEIVEANPVAEQWLTFRSDGRELPNVLLRCFVRQLVEGEMPTKPSIIEFPDFRQPELRACWEILDCDKSDCPAYGAEERRCWLIPGTFCGSPGRGAASPEEKCAICEECPLYQQLKKVSFQAHASRLTKDGQIIGSVIVLHDITRLQELDRLKSKFVSNVSHELRTPLTNIKLYLSLLCQGQGMTERQERYLQTLERETARLEKLIEDLLDLSRLEMGAAQPEKEALDVAEVVQQVLLVHQPLAESKGIALDSELPADLPPLVADRNQVIQLLTNLLSNALNYTPQGGEVTVRAASVRRDERAWLTLAVQDTGPGIPPEERERIFDRFYRGEAMRYKVPGTGLGLAIVKEILALHGGFIELDSEVGSGSTFTAWLPLKEE